VTDSTLELRLATAMTGGVSLAIWMAGVTREINLLSQASQWRRVEEPFPPGCTLTKQSAASLKLYAELIDLLDMVVDVDVLSGTSAGGINAAMLASSRVTGSDLGGLRGLWLDLGALTDLLRNPRDKHTPSLLYGDENMLATLVKQIPKLEKGPFLLADFPGGARTPPTTLYITTTLLTGETGRFTDSFGTLVQDVDRRGLFTFTEADLATPDTVPALALAARSSASFPVAFEPSFLPFLKGTAKRGGVPARPAMERFTNITRPHWVADGGLLDNRPIDVLLQRIFDRAAHRPVRRVLLFVVPSSGPAPDLVGAAPQDNVNEPLGLIDALLKDLAAITTQSIAADLRAIRTHQDRMEARTDARLRLAELAAARKPKRLLTPSLLADYRTRVATRRAAALTSALMRQLSTWQPGPPTSTESIPEAWAKAIAACGDVERVCRRQITTSILSHWSQPPDQPLPVTTADLARYGQPACGLAEACALAIARAANQLAKSKADITAVARLSAVIHRVCQPSTSSDFGGLVREVCTDPVVRQGSFDEAVKQLAREYLTRSEAKAKAWDELGRAFVNGYWTLTRLADNASSASDAQPDSLFAQDDAAASQLNTYLDYLNPTDRSSYLKPEDIPQAIAIKLFDLAATQRAMLPAEADIDQPLDFVQVSADTRNLLAPDWQTAQQKLTGMQLHHFGAFYKRSWRANDWMWGRLDGAGWLVHVLLDPRRVQWTVQARASDRERGPDGPESGARWFLRRLKALGAPDFPSSGYRLSAVGGESDQYLTEDKLLDELGFLDDSSKAIPPSLPWTSLWLAQVWQQRVLDEELDELADSVIGPQGGQQPDWSPTSSRTWAKKVRDAKGDAKYALLDEDPVASETFISDKGSPLMAHTMAKAAATASGAAGSVRQLPGVLKPPLITLRTVTLGGYHVVSLTKGIARSIIVTGGLLLLLGVAFASQSATLLGVTGLTAAAIGGYAIVLGTWQFSSRLLSALLSLTLVGAVLSLATPVIRKWLFGTEKDPGIVGTHTYWLGTQWWHPIGVVGAIALVVTVIAAAKPVRRPRHRSRESTALRGRTGRS
jgi:patatin-related protein